MYACVQKITDFLTMKAFKECFIVSYKYEGGGCLSEYGLGYGMR